LLLPRLAIDELGFGEAGKNCSLSGKKKEL
jgi:hypothetical protein